MQKEVRFDGVMVSISEVKTSENLRQSKVLLSIFPFVKADTILQNLIKREGFFQSQLHQKLYMKPMPKIKFLLDNSQQQARRVSEILEEDERERKAI